MRVLAVHVVGDYDDAEVVCGDRRALDRAIGVHRPEGDDDPPVRLVELGIPHLLEIVDARPGADTQPGGRVRVVSPVRGEEGD